MMMPQGKFTERFKWTTQIAREESSRLQRNYVGSEHLLLAILRLGEGTAVAILKRPGLDLDQLRTSLEAVAPASVGQVPAGQVLFTRPAKLVLELAAQEAAGMQSRHVGTEHLLLGLASKSQATTASVLAMYGMTEDTIREAIRTLPRAEDKPHPEEGETVQRCSWCHRTPNEVARLITGPNWSICNECVQMLVDILSQEGISIRVSARS